MLGKTADMGSLGPILPNECTKSAEVSKLLNF